MTPHSTRVTRRAFVRSAVAAGGLTVLGAAARGQARKTFKAGLIGCGGRGTGAAANIIDAGKAVGVEVRFTALADAFADRMRGTRGALKRRGQEVPQERCFAGFDAYKKLIDSDVDMVLMATPPNFRPVHFQAAVQAGKHTFIEKPVAVDPAGCRTMYQTGELAAKKGLAVLSGLCLRHHVGYAGMRARIADGSIGRVLGGIVYYCVGRLWHRDRKEGWSDAEYLARNWVNFTQLSGDHIVEQHVHTIDMLNWCVGEHPLAAVAIGARHRRITGNQYDCFGVDFEFPRQLHVHSLSRQINGCWNRGNGVHLLGQKGWADNGGGVRLWEDDRRLEPPKLDFHRSMYVQEHIVLLKSLLKGEPVNDAKAVTDATLSAIMGRIAAYTGQRVTWEQLTDPQAKGSLANLEVQPTAKDFETGEVMVPEEKPPVPGKG